MNMKNLHYPTKCWSGTFMPFTYGPERSFTSIYCIEKNGASKNSKTLYLKQVFQYLNIWLTWILKLFKKFRNKGSTCLVHLYPQRLELIGEVFAIFQRRDTEKIPILVPLSFQQTTKHSARNKSPFLSNLTEEAKVEAKSYSIVFLSWRARLLKLYSNY